MNFNVYSLLLVCYWYTQTFTLEKGFSKLNNLNIAFLSIRAFM